MAKGSLMEVETQTAIALRLKYLKQEKQEQVKALTLVTVRLLNGLIRALRHKL
jgi:four helix bundle protein